MTLLDKKQCEDCGRTYQPTRTDQKYDNAKCRKRAEWKRAKATAKKPPTSVGQISKPLRDPIPSLINAVANLGHGVRDLAVASGIPEAIQEAELALEKFEDGFNLMYDSLERTR